MSWKLKWAILIAGCPSFVRPSCRFTVCPSVCNLPLFALFLKFHFSPSFSPSSLWSSVPPSVFFLSTPFFFFTNTLFLFPYSNPK
jgi:hypothetical protein